MEIPSSSVRSTRRSFFKFAIAFLAIILLGYVAFIVAYNIQHWDEIKLNRETERAVESWIDVYRNDRAGGLTPDETIDLFIAALEKGDVDLATSYFMPDDEGNREKERAMMRATFDAGDFQKLADIMRNRVVDYDGVIGDNFFSFLFRDTENVPAGGVSLQFNGNVWKIEHF